MEHLYLEPWKISFDHIPNKLEIHAEVIMHQFVPHTSDGFPRDIGMCILEGGGEAFGCLANDLKIANYGVLRLPVYEEAVFARCRVGQNVLDGIPNMKQIDTVVLHKGTASAWMRCAR